MRITYVTPRYSPYIGGVEVHVEQLARYMAAKGHDVHVLTHLHDPALPVTDQRDGVKIRRFRVPIPSQHFGFSPELWSYLRRPEDDLGILHAHAYHASPALGVALLHNRPFVFTPHYHGTGHSWFRSLLHPPYRRLGRRIFDRAARVICVSTAEADLVLQHFPQVADRLSVIHNGVDVARIKAATPFPSRQPVVLSAGRLEDYKQVQSSVAAMRHMNDGFVLRVLGDGPSRPSLERLVAELNLSDRVQLLGRVSDDELYRWFKTASVYVSMSTNEAYPITPMEALIAGSRVVASDIPAHREVARNTMGAMALVPPDIAPSSLAERFATVARLEPVPPRVASWEDVTNDTLSIYHQAAGASAR